ncbi:MAG: hypothetical protein N2321_07840 [Melioribacteraceae bacterium]|nr:hypothetical protein [Melioribacteraceae bacterium]
MRKFILIIITTILLYSCTTLTLKPADFAWPIENVLKVDNKGFITEQRYSFSVNVKPIFFDEFKDSTNFVGKELRIIRDKAGFYFITGKDFKNVYVFKSIENGLMLENKIIISETQALASPVFNQRNQFIELIDSQKKYQLTSKGLVR